MLYEITEHLYKDELYGRASFGYYTTDLQKETVRLYMDELQDMGLGPRSNANDAEWVDHANWMIPRIQSLGLVRAKFDRDKRYPEKRK